MPPVLCRCGHPRAVHDHIRGGSDCSLCGQTACRGWNPPPWWWRWLHRNRFLEAENRMLWEELGRMYGSERKLRNVIALRPYNPGSNAC